MSDYNARKIKKNYWKKYSKTSVDELKLNQVACQW